MRGKERLSRSEPLGGEWRSVRQSCSTFTQVNPVSWGWQFIFQPQSAKQGTKQVFYKASVRSKMIDRLKYSIQKVTCLLLICRSSFNENRPWICDQKTQSEFQFPKCKLAGSRGYFKNIYEVIQLQCFAWEANGLADIEKCEGSREASSSKSQKRGQEFASRVLGGC